MSRSLYEEAVADAQKLRALAEETAKNKVVEAVMPKIRDMVNKRILGEQLDDMNWDDLEDSEEIEFSDTLEAPVSDDMIEPASEETDHIEQDSPTFNITAQGDVNIGIDDSEDDSEDMVLTDTMAEALGRLLRGESEESKKLASIEETISKLKRVLESANKNQISVSQRHRLSNVFNHCLREAINLHSKVILNEQNTQEKLEQRLANTIKEMKHMSKSHRQNIFDLLFEEDEKKTMSELEEAELSLELEDEEVEDLAAASDADAVDAALEDILSGLELEVGVGEELEDEEVELEDEESELEDEDEEVEVGEEDMVEEVYEIDESMLRRELHRMKKLREQEEGRAAAADPSLAHGGEDLGDVILDVSEDDLLNALADELGDFDGGEPQVESRTRRTRRTQRPQRRTRTSSSVQESRKINQYRNALAGMKNQLVEMNLFNAKLLYANKLMQNKNITVKQQRAIVEALDNAKTLREAKLLYKSLSESLIRRSRSSKKINEGTLRSLGSSSRSTRSAQSRSTGVEADRWAILAGMKPGND